MGNNSSDPLSSFGTPKQLGNDKLHGRPFENIFLSLIFKYEKHLFY